MGIMKYRCSVPRRSGRFEVQSQEAEGGRVLDPVLPPATGMDVRALRGRGSASVREQRTIDDRRLGPWDPCANAEATLTHCYSRTPMAKGADHLMLTSG